MKNFDRRKVLRGLGGASIALPWLQIMGGSRTARAEGPITKLGPNGAPKRFVVFFTPNGHGADWFKNKIGPDGKLVLAPALKPLERHKEHLLFLDGINNRSALFVDKSETIDPGHVKPMVNLMTARPHIGASQGGGISIDQEIANAISENTKIPSLQLSTLAKGPQSQDTLSYRGVGLAMPTTGDPLLAFKRLFTDLKTQPGGVDRTQADRKSVLDGITQEFSEFIGTLGGEDRAKVEAHLEAIRRVEKGIAATPRVISGCMAPPAPKGSPGFTAPEYATVGQSHMDIVAAAFACDLTRVATVTWGTGQNIHLPGFPQALHDASHEYGEAGWPMRNRYTAWFAEQFALFLDKLAAQKEGDRSVLDNTVFYWCSEHGCGNHNYDRMPLLVAGSGGGYFKTGRVINYPNQTSGLGYEQSKYNSGRAKLTGPGHGELYTSFLNAMGVPATTFGVESECRGPLPGLTA